MKLSEHLKNVQAWIEKHGDVEFLVHDAEYGIDEPEEPTLYRFINNEHISQDMHDRLLQSHKTLGEYLLPLDDVWNELSQNLKDAWESKEKFILKMTLMWQRHERILTEWESAPKVLML